MINIKGITLKHEKEAVLVLFSGASCGIYQNH